MTRTTHSLSGVVRLPAAVLLLAAALALACALECRADESAPHRLDITIQPETQSLTGTARLDASRHGGGRAVVLLAPDARIASIRAAGRDVPYGRDGPRLLVDVPENASTLVIEYSCRFDDPVEEQPASMDNPGFGVMGSISDKGVFLLPGSGWYPWMPDSGAHYDLTVRAPRGVYAVTTGGLHGHEDAEHMSLSRWDAWSPDGRLPLAAGRWVVQRSEDGPVPVMTYFSEQLTPLAGRYLEAASRHIAFFDTLHGAYPFPQFSVVENFFPTGYGFPGFTLLGGRVLALPFIPETSLRHEVAHCWWGNGVLVEWEQGNWCEGLTSYVADYLSKEREGPEEAREYRIRTLRRYSLVVPPDLDFPLTEFGSRTSPATQAVGYGKAMFVFHMLRQRVGDDAFWQALRDVYAEHLFEPVSWDTFRNVFAAPELMGPDGADRFFDQWVERSGAADLSLEAVSQAQDRGWLVEATVIQGDPAYDLSVPVLLETTGGDETTKVELSRDARQASVSLRAGQEPVRMAADPDADIFRRLAPEEVPATVNRIKGSQGLVAVVAESLPPDARLLAEWVLISLNQRGAAVLGEAEAVRTMAGETDVLFFGMPVSPELRALVEDAPAGAMYLGSGGLPGTRIPAESDVVFFVDKRLEGNGGDAPIIAVFDLRSGAGLDERAPAARKLMHYGTYSYLFFQHGDNLGKGVWEELDSPMTVRLKE
ncbi:MAG: M1 family metallopeptidase [Oceanidesulfovibrio sp.]